MGSESHYITILDEEDHILYNQKVAHKINEFTESIKKFKKIEEKERGKLSFALEGKNGYSGRIRGQVSTFDITYSNTKNE